MYIYIYVYISGATCMSILADEAVSISVSRITSSNVSHAVSSRTSPQNVAPPTHDAPSRRWRGLPSAPRRTCGYRRGGCVLQELAFTRYSCIPKLSCTIKSFLYCPLHLHCSHYCNTVARLMRNIRPPPDPPCVLAFTRYGLTSSRSCTNQSSFHSSGPPALPTLVQYYCTAIGQHTTSHLTPLVYAIHHIILAMAISCKGQGRGCAAGGDRPAQTCCSCRIRVYFASLLIVPL